MQPKIKALSVHVLTALGVVCGLFALEATISGHAERAFLWLGIALFIDGIDGIFARRYHVKAVLPAISGETLDLCVDYVTYVFVPALMLLLTGKLTGPWGMCLAALICVSSLYHFADAGSKSDDHCFIGFPAIWNIVAFYIFALALPGWVSGTLIVLCIVMTFVPWKWVHPMRVTRLRGPTLVVTAVWGSAAVAAVWTGFPAGPILSPLLVLGAIYGVGLSLYLGRGR